MDKLSIKGNRFKRNSYSIAFTQAFEDFFPIPQLPQTTKRFERLM